MLRNDIKVERIKLAVIMDYEKKYKELVGQIKKAHLYAQTDSTKAVLEDILSELKESEDEKIRKYILSCCEETIKANDRGLELSMETTIKLRDWLEKQGAQNPYSGVSFEYNGHTWGMCARDNGVEILVDGEIKERVYLFDRPQGKSALETLKEEKVDNQNCANPTNKVEPKFKVGDWVVDKEGNISKIMRVDNGFNHIIYACRPIEENSRDWASYSENDIRLWDKVEPKFHKGEWVTNGIETVQITGYDIDYGYQVDYKGNLQHRDTDVIEKEYHLWTIQDAKDGDVLIDDLGVILFRKIGNKKYENAVDYHCVVYISGKFEIQEGLSCWGLSTYRVLCPATKKQRERFFAVMRDSGYEWDADRKELKKIEQSKLTAFEEAVKDMMDDYRDAIDDNKATTEEVKERAAYMLSLIPQKPAEWREDDEEICRAIINDIANDKSMCTFDISKGICDKKINWLKSLKDRVGCEANCTTTKEWSEEDKQYLLVCKNALAKYQASDKWDAKIISRWLDNKLKSIRPQNWTKEDKERYLSCLQRLSTGNPEQPETINSKWFKEHVYPQNAWKPSEEQIDALSNILKYFRTLNAEEETGETIDRLVDLHEQLKKLREK